MWVKKELFDFNDFVDNSWSCDEVWEKIEELGLEDEAIQTIEAYNEEYILTETELNDFIRFELWDIMDLSNREEENDFF